MEFDKKYTKSAGPGLIRFEIGRVGNFLCDLQLWPQIFLQPLDLQECKVPHLKDLIHICLEAEAQSCGTFNVSYVGSKYPYFISYRGSCQNRSNKHSSFISYAKIHSYDKVSYNTVEFLYLHFLSNILLENKHDHFKI